MSYVAFIPARSGSKRVPNKNIKMLGGRPLLVWTLEACVLCKNITNVILSTDSEYYMELATKHVPNEKLKFDLRDREDASDKMKIFDYLLFKKHKIFKDTVEENFILALPTAPLRNTDHLNEAIKMFENSKKPVFSATEYEFPLSFAFTVNKNREWKPIFKDSPMITGNTRSQDNLVNYRPNGAIYVRKISDLQTQKLNTLYENAIPYLMDRDFSIDLDNEIDFKIVEAIIQSSGIS